MIDLHCHIIPYIDDGAKDIHTALAMAKHAYRNGVKTIVATPHCNLRDVRTNYRSREYDLLFATFRAAIRQSRIPITVLPGAEVFAHEDNIRELIDGNHLVTINHSRYLLVEFGFHMEAYVITRTLDAIARRGLIPVIAHPERYDAIQAQPDYVMRWFDRGYIIQLNKGSLLGRLGKGARICSHELLANGVAHVIASDAHDMSHRPPGFHSLIRSVPINRDYLRLLLEVNPKRIISNQPIPNPTDETFDAEEEYE